MTDVLMVDTLDGGDIQIPVGSDVVMTSGLETSVYLSLFGGNEEDDGSDATSSLQWWANFAEPDPARRMRGRLQALIRARALTSALLREISEAARADLEWMTVALVDAVRVSSSIVAPRRVEITIELDIGAETVTLRYGATWGAA